MNATPRMRAVTWKTKPTFRETVAANNAGIAVMPMNAPRASPKPIRA